MWDSLFRNESYVRELQNLFMDIRKVFLQKFNIYSIEIQTYTSSANWDALVVNSSPSPNQSNYIKSVNYTYECMCSTCTWVQAHVHIHKHMHIKHRQTKSISLLSYIVSPNLQDLFQPTGTHIHKYTHWYIATNVYMTHQSVYTLTVCRPPGHHGCPTVCHRWCPKLFHNKSPLFLLSDSTLPSSGSRLESSLLELEHENQILITKLRP